MVTRVLQKVGHIGAQPVLAVVCPAPQTETAAGSLLRTQTADGLGYHFVALSQGKRFESQQARPVLIYKKMRISAAGGLLHTAIWVAEQALHRAAHIQRWRIRQTQMGLHRSGYEASQACLADGEGSARANLIKPALLLLGRKRLHLQGKAALQLERASTTCAFHLYPQVGQTKELLIRLNVEPED